MRLTQLKLAGFKSFVDPTTIPTPSSLVGVVGPNGCGKSNIIDAVRWVMGESRASELRGESMQDVIFNGSENRKPAARASVELSFDNSQGRAAGQWSAYSEISVSRVLTRDGKSTYYINNQVVRRRDINDIFLGTGLGARGYAIIGQGMINRLIEAKPEELRFYLEEAAGVSRYKERRRETENRLRDTRENLVRLEDILLELDGQIETLETQAKIATKYKDLQAQGHLKQQLLWLLREQEAQQTQQRRTLQIQEHQTKLEQEIALQRTIELQLEQLRQQHYQLSDLVHTEQGALYEASSLVSKLEAEIKHAKQSKASLEQRQQELQQQNNQWAEQVLHCNTQIQEVEVQIEDVTINCEELIYSLEQASQDNPELNSRINRLANKKDDLNHNINKLQQQVALKHQNIDNAKRQIQNIDLKITKAQQDLSNTDYDYQQEILKGEQDLDLLNKDLDNQQNQFVHLEAQLPNLQQIKSDTTKENHSLKKEITQTKANLKALQDIQQDISQEIDIQKWLQNNGLDGLQALWQKISIKPDWESAIESVLKHKLLALDITNSGITINKLLHSLPPKNISFYTLEQVENVSLNTIKSLTHLLDYVQVQSPQLKALIQYWLHNVYVCEDLKTAISVQHKLSSDAYIVTPQGHMVDLHSIHFYKPDTQQSGILARQAQIQQLQKQLKAQSLFIEQSDNALVKAENNYSQCVGSMNQVRTQISELTQQTYKLQLDINSKKQLQSQAQEKQELIKESIEDLHLEKQNYTEEQYTSADEIVDLEKNLENFQDALQTNTQESDLLREKLASKQDTIDALKRQQQEAQFKQRSLRTRIEELSRNLQLANQQQENTQKQLNSLQGELFNISESNYALELQNALDKKVAQEQSLNQARINLEQISSKMRDVDEQRLRVERSLQPIREEINQLQLKEQAARISVEQYREQLNEQNANRTELIEVLQNADKQWQQTTWLQTEVKRISKDIDDLGAVNMAALQELENASERQQFLHGQNEDLIQAINTLEDAIRNIDKETRVLLKDTFEAVNKNLNELFPRLFGGGKAYLIITGDEILDAGVQVMAQPPGKRNSTIQLLSGGEKALTAIALVFAFFKLNPAPFCLLDEVDAPLDDANTDRYAKLVQSMSEQTQFLFISHNKIAMQMANHLIGVTMQEQGVSRVVAVDMEKALDLAHN